MEGRTIAIEYRWTEGRDERFAEIVAEFIRLNVNIIVTNATTAALAAKQAIQSYRLCSQRRRTRSAQAWSRVLAQPGGNVTGLSNQSTDLAAKRLEILREFVPNLHRLAIMGQCRSSARLPTMDGFRDYVEAGGLMSYGPNIPHQYRRAADYADKILRGTKPRDIPVEQPTKFDLVVNLITAQAVGLTLPPTLIARADEVIE